MYRALTIILRTLLVCAGFTLSIGSYAGSSDGNGIKSWLGVWEGIPQCYQYRVVGVCGWPIPKGLVVHHYLPTAYIEVVKRGTDSVFIAKSGNAQTGDVVPSAGLPSSQWQQHEVRIWLIDDELRSDLTLGRSDCALCKDVHAGGPAQEFADNGNENQSEGGGILGSEFLNELGGTGECVTKAGGIGSLVAKELMSALSNNVQLLYDTAMDETAWHTGCRDIALSIRKLPKAVSECLLGRKSGVPNETPRETDPVPNNFDKIANEAPCIGPWGAKLPRTGWSWGKSEPIAVSLAAYRGMHLAAYEFETYGCPVGDDQLMQPVHPEFGDCYSVGAKITEVEKEITRSVDGRYGFMWWTPAGCCISFKRYASCSGFF